MTCVKSNIINESPDYYFDDNDDEILWCNSTLKAVTFGWYDDKLYTLASNPKYDEDRNITHSDLGRKIIKELEDDPKYAEIDLPFGIARSMYQYPGRLWIVTKVISFWEHPDKKTMPIILKELEDNLNINILNDPDWRIEILNDPANRFSKSSWQLIPVSKYIGSNKVPKSILNKDHARSPLLKNKPDADTDGNIKKPPRPMGQGSTHKNYDRRQAWRRAKQAESLELNDLSNILLEKLLMGEPVTVPELRKILNTKVLNFEFVKLNGEVRPANGTTMMKYIPKEDQPSGLNSPSSDKVAAFYDLDKDAWRSVSNKSKDIVIAADNETGKPKIVISDKKPKEEKEPKPPVVNGKPSPRPVAPPVQHIVKPSITPDKIPNIPEIEPGTFDIRKKSLDTKDPNVIADDIKDDEIVVDDNIFDEPANDIEDIEDVDDIESNEILDLDNSIIFPDKEIEDEKDDEEIEDEEKIIDTL